MYRLLVLLALGSTVSCLELEYLCPTDHFVYNNIQVNSILRAKVNVTLEPVSYFLIKMDEDCDDYKWLDVINRMISRRIRDDFNEQMLRLYSESFLNSKEKILSEIDMMINKTQKLQGSLNKVTSNEGYDLVSNCLTPNFRKPMERARALLGHLFAIYRNVFPLSKNTHLKLDRNNMTQLLGTVLERSHEHLADSQTMAFLNEFEQKVYLKPIVQMGKFVFHRKSRIIFDPSSTGTVNFEIVLPFQDTDAKEKKDCVSLDSLPRFFREASGIVTPSPSLPPTIFSYQKH